MRCTVTWKGFGDCLTQHDQNKLIKFKYRHALSYDVFLTTEKNLLKPCVNHNKYKTKCPESYLKAKLNSGC